MKWTLYLLMYFPLLIKAQDEKGIKFEQSLSWQQLQAKAKAENKYIFVDCYTTWCGPCKAMEKDVYPSDKLGAYLNDKFISVKMQMDTSKTDGNAVQKRYGDAHAIQQQYKITGYPTFLFFSPDGRLVHRGLGYRQVDDFIRLAGEANDPSKQYYTLMENYQHGKKDYTKMASLALITQEQGDQDLANTIAGDYVNNYLDKLNEEELYTKENIWFMGQFPALLFSAGSKGKYFNLFYHHSDKVDSILDLKDYADYYVKMVIGKEEINDKLWQSDKPVTRKPDWNKISKNISKKYNISYAETLIYPAQLAFYMRIKDWREFARLREDKIKKHPPKPATDSSQRGLARDAWVLNVDAWNVFELCNDKRVLAKALSWSDLSIKLDSENVQVLDTKANLLYKLGRVKEAIDLEEKALEIARSTKQEAIASDYVENLAKMQNREPTWTVK
ncbi:thioredoxin-like protein [Chitinophaga niastensis]|uniref:Thioredoxin-like protein n=1 Tax=Chitinophaga niastensis TaxID=536980 RepID=A0A2P8HHL1_CHINA|nr:thioredoxin fold domain-containing protein [Chitinophaga niastensis]PSL45687.1 thioredoxin-like protein [Chitinophaga niastensis]